MMKCYTNLLLLILLCRLWLCLGSAVRCLADRDALLYLRSYWYAGRYSQWWLLTYFHVYIRLYTLTTSPSRRVRSIAIFVSVFVSVFPLAYLKNNTSKFHEIVTGSIARSASRRYLSLPRGRLWGFSPHRGDTLHRWGWNLSWRKAKVPSSMPNFTPIGATIRV